MKKKTPQITCFCKAYNFPHRVSGGACCGTEWISSYRELSGALCNGCSCLNNSESGAQGERFNTCDCEAGLEDIKHCEAYQDLLHSQDSVRFPMSLSSFLSSITDDDRYGDCGEIFA